MKWIVALMIAIGLEGCMMPHERKELEYRRAVDHWELCIQNVKEAHPFWTFFNDVQDFVDEACGDHPSPSDFGL